MSKRIILSSLILLFLVFAAIITHLVNNSGLMSQLSSPKSQVSSLKSHVSSLESHVSGLKPEHKLLLHGQLDINSASIAELEAIPRIGPGLAKRIHRFVKEKNVIKNIEELLEVKGIGPGILKIIRPYLKTFD